ncbi:MAG TPA: MerR family transcriptional regulator [Thermomicrobiaceae bacterium]|nr:MerR family transcriptional regulator [Thermomicrobiaceae bacterium]
MLTIGEVAREAGVRASAIRYYEAAGLLPAPERVSGQRRYEAGVLRRLALIRGAQRAGLTIAEIRLLLSGFPEDTIPSTRWRALATGKLAEVDALIGQLEETKRVLQRALLCDCASLDDCADITDRLGSERGPQRSPGRSKARPATRTNTNRPVEG